MDCEIVSGGARIAPEWQALTTRSLVPSGHNLPELHSAALRQWPEGRIATVRDGDGLRLALPVMRRRFPLPILHNWSSPVNFHGMPHVDSDAAGSALTCLLKKIGHPLLLHSVPTGGPLWGALTAAAGHVAVIETWERAVLQPKGTFADWFETNFERKRRKEYRRLRSRLSEQGAFETSSLKPGDDVASWVNDFVMLEAAGWKGSRGTAMQADTRTVAALHEACMALSLSGRLRFWKLTLDGKPIAMLFALVDGTEAWLGKIAYDETLSRFSPGVLLILHATEQIFAEGLAQADSCAIPDHPMINHLWRDRLQVVDVMVAASSMSATAFRATVAAERLRRSARRIAKSIFHRMTGRRAS